MEGIFPLIPSLDHVGPMAGTVRDVGLMWQALHQGKQGGTTVRTVGYDPGWLGEVDSGIAGSFERILDGLGRRGIQVREIRLPELNEVSDVHGRIFFVEGAAYHCTHHRLEIPNYPSMAQDWFAAAIRMPIADYVDACERRLRYTRKVDQILDEVNLILTPTLSVLHPPREAPELVIAGQPHDFTLAMVRQTCLFNHTGHPALAMPMARPTQMPPPSLQIVGRHRDENRILALAKRIEDGVAARSL